MATAGQALDCEKPRDPAAGVRKAQSGVLEELPTKGEDLRGRMHGKVLPARVVQVGKQGLWLVEDSGICLGGPCGYRKDNCFLLLSFQ